MKKFSLLLFFLFLVSCATRQFEPRAFVVQRDVPNSPAIAVVSDNVKFSNIIEALILEYGIKLYTPPSSIYTERELIGTENRDSDQKAASIKQKYNKIITNANYIISAYTEEISTAVDKYRIKILKVQGEEILSSFIFEFNKYEEQKSVSRLKLTLHDVLKKIGLKVKASYLEYPMACEFFISNSIQIKSINDWKAYCSSGKKPYYIPSAPDKIYKGSGWISWSQWFEDIKRASPKKKE